MDKASHKCALLSHAIAKIELLCLLKRAQKGELKQSCRALCSIECNILEKLEYSIKKLKNFVDFARQLKVLNRDETHFSRLVFCNYRFCFWLFLLSISDLRGSITVEATSNTLARDGA